MVDGDYRRLGCSATDCEGIHKAHGYCLRHYRQWQRGGVKQDAKNCAHCGLAMSGKPAGSMYCGKRCKMAAWVKANPARWAELNAVKRANPPRLVSPIYTWYCEQCGVAMVRRRKARCCSTECDHKARYVSTAPATRTCASCSGIFSTPPFKTRPTAFCSVACKRAAVRAQKDKREARLRGATVETVNPIKVFERDRWRCMLCGVKTPASKRGTYADNAPELDHIIPLSKGGDHSYLNTQCACRRCNGMKSNTPRGQLLLIG